MKIILENEKDEELLSTYNQEVFDSDERCANCDELRHSVLSNDFEGFCARYSPMCDLHCIDADILSEREQNAKDAFNICKRCIWCYVDDCEYED